MINSRNDVVPRPYLMQAHQPIPSQYHFGMAVLSRHIFALIFRFSLHALRPIYILIFRDTQLGQTRTEP